MSKSVYITLANMYLLGFAFLVLALTWEWCSNELSEFMKVISIPFAIFFCIGVVVHLYLAILMEGS